MFTLSYVTVCSSQLTELQEPNYKWFFDQLDHNILNAIRQNNFDQAHYIQLKLHFSHGEVVEVSGYFGLLNCINLSDYLLQLRETRKPEDLGHSKHDEGLYSYEITFPEIEINPLLLNLEIDSELVEVERSKSLKIYELANLDKSKTDEEWLDHYKTSNKYHHLKTNHTGALTNFKHGIDNIRLELKHLHPCISFSVRQEKPKGSGSIVIKWIDGPTESIINTNLKPFNVDEYDFNFDLRVHTPTPFSKTFGNISSIRLERCYTANSIALAVKSILDDRDIIELPLSIERIESLFGAPMGTLTSKEEMDCFTEVQLLLKSRDYS